MLLSLVITLCVATATALPAQDHEAQELFNLRPAPDFNEDNFPCNFPTAADIECLPFPDDQWKLEDATKNKVLKTHKKRIRNSFTDAIH